MGKSDNGLGLLAEIGCELTSSLKKRSGSETTRRGRRDSRFCSQDRPERFVVPCVSKRTRAPASPES